MALPTLLQCRSLFLARSGGSRQRNMMPAIEVEADRRRTVVGAVVPDPFQKAGVSGYDALF
jgi:hypothetical protein